MFYSSISPWWLVKKLSCRFLFPNGKYFSDSLHPLYRWTTFMQGAMFHPSTCSKLEAFSLPWVILKPPPLIPRTTIHVSYNSWAKTAFTTDFSLAFSSLSFMACKNCPLFWAFLCLKPSLYFYSLFNSSKKKFNRKKEAFFTELVISQEILLKSNCHRKVAISQIPYRTYHTLFKVAFLSFSKNGIGKNSKEKF